jgi:hypothetical protein
MGDCPFRGKIAPGTEHSMAGNKTTQTTASADDYLAAIEDPARRADCEALAALMQKVTQEPPKMWGPAIVGFGSYHYVYESGREGDMCVVGFSSRKADITLYLQGLREGQDALLASLGKHKADGGCLHIKRMGDVDASVLEALVANAVARVNRNHG